jgi:hypothetical protein
MDHLPTLAQVRAMLAAIHADVVALAALECWPPELLADIQDRLRRAPAVSLPDQAAHFAQRLHDERKRRGLGRDAPTEPAPPARLSHVILGPTWLYWWRKRKRRGIAKALNPEGAQKPKAKAKGRRSAFLEDFPDERARYMRLVEEGRTPEKKS